MTTTAELNEKLESLVQVIDQFVNGDENTTVTTLAGRYKSLAGVAKQASRSNYMQKVVDYKYKAQAIADALAGTPLLPGNIARVYGEVDWSVNGLYEIQDDKTLRRMDYVDINNLNNILQGSSGIRNVIMTPADIQDNTQNIVYRYQFAKGESRTFGQIITGQIRVFSAKVGASGLSMFNFSYALMKGATVTSNFQITDSHVVAVGGSYPLTNPTFTATLNSLDTYDEIVVRAQWADFLASDPVKIEIYLKGIDKANFI